VTGGRLTGFGYLLAIIRPKKCGSTTTRNHTSTLRPVKVKLIPVEIKMWERSQPLYQDCKYENCKGKNNNQGKLYKTV
jgi:hypothetical protein